MAAVSNVVWAWHTRTQRLQGSTLCGSGAFQTALPSHQAMPSSPQCASLSKRIYVLRQAATFRPVTASADHPQVGVFNEAALQRFDLVLSEAAKNGIKVIFPMVDGDNYLGGPQWYFDQARTAHIKCRNANLRIC